MSETVLHLKDVSRGFSQGGVELHVLRKLQLEVKRGEMVALVGPSGSGKTTLLQIAGLLAHPDSGEVRIGNEDFSKAGDRKRTRARLRNIGFVYQFHHLLPEFSALENVMIPQMLAGVKRNKAEHRAHLLLEVLGLAAREHHRPSQMSGGEQQRVAIARAVANQPVLILADEPTGNLDVNTANGVFAVFAKLVKELKLAALIATHNTELAKSMDNIFEMEPGGALKIN